MKKKLNLKFFGLSMALVVFVVLGAAVMNSTIETRADAAVQKSATLLTVDSAVSRTSEEMDITEAALAAEGGPIEKEAPFRPTMDESALKAIKSAVSSLAPRAGAAAPDLLVPPALRGRNFDGVNQTTAGGWRPPDTHGAVGRTHFIEVTNSHIDIYNKSTTANVYSRTMAAFFGYTTQAIFDPRAVYDSTWNRYVVTAEAFAESTTIQYIFIAISKSGNPVTGGWHIYRINVNFGDEFWDYGQLGMDQDSVFQTANIFNGSISPTTYKDTRMFAVAKARLYNGLGWGVPIFTGLCGSLAPPIVLDQNRYAYFVGACDGTTLTVYRGADLSNPWWSTLVWQSNIDVPDYGAPSDAIQPGTTAVLDTLDGRFVNASTQYGDSLWNIHSIGYLGPGTAAAPKFYEIDVEGAGADTIKQQGMFWAGGHDWNASIAVNTSGEAFVTWSSTFASGNSQAEVRFSGREPADPLGVIPAGTTLFQSPTFYTGFRWGDYSAVSLDPLSTTTCAPNRRAWIVNEKINADGTWGSRIGRIGFCS